MSFHCQKEEGRKRISHGTHLRNSLVCFEIVKLDGAWKSPSQDSVTIPWLDHQVLAQCFGEDVVLAWNYRVARPLASKKEGECKERPSTVFETVSDLKGLQGAGRDDANGSISMAEGVHRLVRADCDLGDGGGQTRQELLEDEEDHRKK